MTPRKQIMQELIALEIDHLPPEPALRSTLNWLLFASNIMEDPYWARLAWKGPSYNERQQTTRPNRLRQSSPGVFRPLNSRRAPTRHQSRRFQSGYKDARFVPGQLGTVLSGDLPTITHVCSRPALTLPPKKACDLASNIRQLQILNSIRKIARAKTPGCAAPPFPAASHAAATDCRKNARIATSDGVGDCQNHRPPTRVVPLRR